MSVRTFEAIVENGQIRLEAGVRLPDRTKVYVVVPDVRSKPAARPISPRLAHPEQAADFKLEVTEEDFDAGVR